MRTRRPDFLVLAFDLGSSSVRSALFDDRGKMVAATLSQRRYAIRYTADGGAELSPQVLRRAAAGCVSETLRQRSRSASLRNVPLRAVSGCSFWHSLLGLDRQGVPVTPVFTWADSRSEPDAAQLRSEFTEREIQLRTGCMLRAPFWPATLRWLRRTDPAVFKKVVRWISPVVWISRELFGVGETSHSMASGTGLYDLASRTWDPALADACEVRGPQLGKITEAPPDMADGPRALRGAAIFPAIGDGAASNLGSGADRVGRVAINIGTSAAVRMVEPHGSASSDLPPGLFRYVIDEKRTLLGGAVSNAGNLRGWCLRVLSLTDEKAIENAISRRAAASDPLAVLPFLVTERAPTWPGSTRGVIAGLTQTTRAGDIFRAAITSTYYRLADILDELARAARCDEPTVIVSGGVLRSPASLALLADCVGRDIHVSQQMESSLRGAALHATAQLGGKIPETPVGRLVRHNPELSELHRVRREQQRALEQLFTSGPAA